ncbi:unnamed protein product [Closterium sp. Yama58-4]|nr:unnamed protein product [Closterium sp. Yama58-4]
MPQQTHTSNGGDNVGSFADGLAIHPAALESLEFERMRCLAFHDKPSLSVVPLALRSSVARQWSHVAMAPSLSAGGVGLSAARPSTSGLSAGFNQRRLTFFPDSELVGEALAPVNVAFEAPAAVSTSSAFCQSAQPAVRQRRGRRGMSAVAAQAVRGEGVVGLTVPGSAVLPSVILSFDPSSPPLSLPTDLLLLAVFDSALSRDDTSAANFTGFAADAPGGAELASIDATLSGALAELAFDLDFRAKPGQVSQILRVPGQPFKRIALMGLGKPDTLLNGEAGAWQSVCFAIASAAKTNLASNVTLAIVGKPEPAEGEEIEDLIAVRGIVTGALVGSFEDVRFKSETKAKAKAASGLKELQVVGLGDAESVLQNVFEAESLAAGIILTRELVNAPPNVLTPAALADVAVTLAASHVDVLSVRVLEREECAALGMGAYMAVAEASAAHNPPKFIHPGGYNLKAGPGSTIHLMKFDMGGAAAVLGAAKGIAAIQLPGVEVHFIIAACENMISEVGMKLGDIITASNGKTIEVNNTDAEGRLTLADALLYAQHQGAQKIVDVATLTGTCAVALGTDIAGLFTPSDLMAAQLESSSKKSGEKVWRMPMEEAYWEGMHSKHADMLNTGPRQGGSITAALFLKQNYSLVVRVCCSSSSPPPVSLSPTHESPESVWIAARGEFSFSLFSCRFVPCHRSRGGHQFVAKGLPWALLDIAGPVCSEKVGGGTGYGASLLYHWVALHSIFTSHLD